MSEDMKNTPTERKQGFFGTLGRFAEAFGSKLAQAGDKADSLVTEFGKKLENTVSDPEIAEKAESVKKQMNSIAEKTNAGLAKGVALVSHGAEKLATAISTALNETEEDAESTDESSPDTAEEPIAEEPDTEEPVAEAAADGHEACRDFDDCIDQLADKAEAWAADAAEKADSWASDTAEKVEAWTADIPDNAGKIAGKVEEWAADTAEKASAFADKAEAWTSEVSDKANEAGDAVADQAADWAERVTVAGSRIVNKAADRLDSFLNGTESSSAEMAQKAAASLENLGDSLGKAAEELGNAADEIAKKMLENFRK